MRIVERLTVDGAPVVVTQFIQGFQTLPVWLQATAQRARSALGTAAAAPPPRAGEFTQLFGPSSGETPPPEVVPPRSAEAPGPSPASSERPPGEFTSVFGPTGGAPPSTPAPPVPRPPEPPSGKGPSVRWREPSPEAKQEDRPADRPMIRWKKEASPKPPSELTRLFGAAGSAPADSTTPPASSLPSEPALPPAGSPPGEFTRLFQPDRSLGVPPAAQPEPPHDYWQALNTPATPSMTPSAFGSTPDPPPPPPAAPTAKEPGEFTRLMSGVPTPPSAGRAATAPASPSGPGGAGGPGEFTRIVAAAGPPAPPPPAQQEDRDAAPTEQGEPGAGGRSRRLLVLLVALAVVFILAAALVLFFAL